MALAKPGERRATAPAGGMALSNGPVIGRESPVTATGLRVGPLPPDTPCRGVLNHLPTLKKNK